MRDVDGNGFALHTLGWKAFQDLCATVLEETRDVVLQNFAPTADGGRDCAFDGPLGKSTVQVKLSGQVGARLSLADIANERIKIADLVASGHAHEYVLITNCSVSGRATQTIENAVETLGVKNAPSTAVSG